MEKSMIFIGGTQLDRSNLVIFLFNLLKTWMFLYIQMHFAVLIAHLLVLFGFVVQWTTRITETGITNLTRITNKMAASSDYLMEYFNGILAVLLE